MRSLTYIALLQSVQRFLRTLSATVHVCHNPSPHQRVSPSLLLSTMAAAEMTRYATAQHDVDMDSTVAVPTGSATEQPDDATDTTLAVPAGPAGSTGSTGPGYAMYLGRLPLATQMQWGIHVDFSNGMWWVMSHEFCDGILNQYKNGAQQVSFVWNWDGTRRGPYQPDGADTSLSRCIINFDTMDQRNIDNGRTRKSESCIRHPQNRRLHNEAMLQSMLSPGTATEHAFADDDSY